MSKTAPRPHILGGSYDRVLYQPGIITTRPHILGGSYDRVLYQPGIITTQANAAHISIINPDDGMTADQLREAAHFMNQLAEQMDNNQPRQRPFTADQEYAIRKLIRDELRK